jgi:tRNA A37 threonylcarbamoyltransferase TsaD
VAGGVSQNKHLQRELKKLTDTFEGINLLLPENQMTTDNAVMIAIAGYINILKGGHKLHADSSLRLKAEGNLSLTDNSN